MNEELHIKDFVANLAHELKTPITAMKVLIETLSDGAIDSPATARQFLKILEHRTDQLAALIADLMTLTKLEQEIDSEEFSVQDELIKPLLESVIQTCEERAADNGATIELICKDDVRAEINGLLMERVVANLLENAIKYSGTRKPIEVNCTRRSGEIIITVEDFGIGIPAEHLPHIFERFYRVNKSDCAGTGLGLSIVKLIVKAHEGFIAAESHPGKGSKFTVRLPVKAGKGKNTFERVFFSVRKYYRKLFKNIYTFDS